MSEFEQNLMQMDKSAIQNVIEMPHALLMRRLNEGRMKFI